MAGQVPSDDGAATHAFKEVDRLRAINADLLEALTFAADEMQRLGDGLSARGPGATVLGMAISKIRKAIAYAYARVMIAEKAKP